MEWLNPMVPPWIRILLEAAAVITAIAVVGGGITWMWVRGRQAVKWCINVGKNIHRIVEELSPNSGGSIKDQVEKAAKNSTTAVGQNEGLKELSEAIIRRVDESVGPLRNVPRDLLALEADLKSLRVDVKKGELKLARFISHWANGDLQTSSLLREERELLVRQDLERASTASDGDGDLT